MSDLSRTKRTSTSSLIPSLTPSLSNHACYCLLLAKVRHKPVFEVESSNCILADCYAAADLFVFSSRTETQGLVLLEAMAAGLPVYAISHLGTRSIVDPRRGAVVAPETVREFGVGMASLVGNQDERVRLSAEARIFALQWSAPARARQLAQIYRSVVRQHRHA